MQVRWISEHLRRERTALLQNMREACLNHRLRFTKDAAIVDSVVCAVNEFPRGPGDDCVDLNQLVEIAEATSASFDTEAQSNDRSGHVARLVADGRAAEVCRNIALSLGRTSPSRATLPVSMDPIRNCYNDWHWPILLMRWVSLIQEMTMCAYCLLISCRRCMHLPLGLCELIMDYLPMPRVWKWSLVRLKKRINLASHAATIDISIILDEMFTDMTLFRGSVQRVHLLNIARNEPVKQRDKTQLHYHLSPHSCHFLGPAELNQRFPHASRSRRRLSALVRRPEFVI